jgi:hypothetical protein
MIKAIRDFVVRGDKDDHKRSLVCGIHWFENGVCVNTRQLRQVLGKSKSSINGAFAKMGFEAVPVPSGKSNLLEELLPFVPGGKEALLQWTIRRRAVPYVTMSEAPGMALPSREVQPNVDVDDSIPLLSGKACLYGCYCGCNCGSNDPIKKECYCVFPDSSFDFGYSACACAPVVWSKPSTEPCFL